MPEKEPRGRSRAFSDAQLRQALTDGLTAPEIAAKYGVSKQAVYPRIAALEKSTVAAVAAPEESRRFVHSTNTELEILDECLRRVQMLLDACHRWLLDPDDPSRYDVGARASEITVIYLPLDEDGEPKSRKPQRKNLQALLAEVQEFGEHRILSAESKYADPRTLVLSTMQECRAILTTIQDLKEKLLNARAVEAWIEELRAALAEVSPEIARAVAENVQRRLSLAPAFGGARPLSAGRTRGE